MDCNLRLGIWALSCKRNTTTKLRSIIEHIIEIFTQPGAAVMLVLWQKAAAPLMDVHLFWRVNSPSDHVSPSCAGSSTCPNAAECLADAEQCSHQQESA